jgi:hypothetical protein
LSAGQISSLVTAIVALAGALTAYLHSRTTRAQLNAHVQSVSGTAEGGAEVKPGG